MAIHLDLISSSKIKVKIIPGPDFKSDLDFLKGLPNKFPIFGIDKTSGKDVFQYWEMNISNLASIVKHFKRNSILCQSDKATKSVDKISRLQIPVSELPKFDGEIDWIYKPLFQEQEDYIRSSFEREHMLLAFAPGMGKTYTSLMRCHVTGAKKTLVVVPGVLLPNWVTETRTFLDKPSMIYHGTPKQRQKLRQSFDDYEYIITTNAMIPELEHLPFDNLIVDEAHLYAHASTKKYGILEKFIKNHDLRIQLLSGTPILHTPLDLWAVINLIYPDLAGPEKAWISRYQKVLVSFTKVIKIRGKNGMPIFDEYGQPKTFRKEIPIVTESQNLDEMYERLNPIMWLVKREGKVSFKEAFDFKKVCMTPKQERHYDQVKAQVLLKLDSVEMTPQNAMVECLRLQQAAEGMYLLDETMEDSGKLDYCRDLIKSTTHPIVFWFKFKHGAKMLAEEFGDEAVLLTGDLSANAKKLSQWAFQGCKTKEDEDAFNKIKPKNYQHTPGSARIFIATLSEVGSLGYNLHKAYHQVFVSWHDSATVNEQAAARLMRPGQQSDIVQTDFVMAVRKDGRSTYDKIMLSRSFRNQEDCAYVVDGKSSLTYAQIKQLAEEIRNS